MKAERRAKALARGPFLAHAQGTAASENVLRLAEDFSNLSAEEKQEFLLLVGSDEDEISAEWKEEVQRRAIEIAEGRTTLIEGEDFLKRLRAI